MVGSAAELMFLKLSSQKAHGWSFQLVHYRGILSCFVDLLFGRTIIHENICLLLGALAFLHLHQGNLFANAKNSGYCITPN